MNYAHCYSNALQYAAEPIQHNDPELKVLTAAKGKYDDYYYTRMMRAYRRPGPHGDDNQWYWAVDSHDPITGKTISKDKAKKLPTAGQYSYASLPNQDYVEQLHAGAVAPSEERPPEMLPEDYYA